MDLSALRSRILRPVHSMDGRQADIVLIEPNGDEHVVRCLLRGLETEIGGDPEALTYLNSRYGDPAVCFTAREAVLRMGT